MHEAKYVLATAAAREQNRGGKKKQIGEAAVVRGIDSCEMMEVRDGATLRRSYPCRFLTVSIDVICGTAVNVVGSPAERKVRMSLV